MAFSEPKKFGKLALRTALLIITLILVSSYFLAMFLGLMLLLSPDGIAPGNQHRSLPILLFIVVGFYTPVALNIRLVFLFLLSVFAFCFFAAWRSREDFHKAVGKVFSSPVKRLFNSYLFAMPTISSMMLVAVVAIHSFQEANGIPTGSIPLPPNRFEALFELSYFAFIEEIGFRVTPIGAFLILRMFWVGRKNGVALTLGQRLKLFLTVPVDPEKGKKMVGLKTVSAFGFRGGVSLGEWVIVFFTSIVFGLAHYLPGGGWEIGKITSASAVGLTMSLTYLLYGVQAPILLHWFFNYYGYAYSSASELFGPVQVASVMVDSVTLILGCFGWLALLVFGLRKILGQVSQKR